MASVGYQDAEACVVMGLDIFSILGDFFGFVGISIGRCMQPHTFR